MNGVPFSLDGKRVLVTGASSGIGRATAIALAGSGAELVITGRDSTRLNQTLAAIGGAPHATLVVDLTESDAPATIEEGAGALNGVVHSAGVSALAPLRLASPDMFDRLWAVNYRAPMLVTQALLKRGRIADGGSIVFIGSISAHIGVAGVAAYAGTKAALAASARCLAMEVAKRRIRVNTIAPGIVETEMAAAGSAMLGDTVERQRADYPLGFGKPEDVANLAAFLLSDASRWITGTSLVIDGGHTIG
ncbi:MAG: SDR family oxidoreductase [Burkholderiales bacterium]|nr:SDR family oxidoreductase [Burkholderiales bacterium]